MHLKNKISIVGALALTLTLVPAASLLAFSSSPSHVPLQDSTPQPSATPTLPYLSGTPGVFPTNEDLPVLIEAGEVLEESITKWFTFSGFPGPAQAVGGYGGTHHYMKNQRARASVIISWYLKPSRSGYYDLLVFIPASTLATQNASYQVVSGGFSTPILRVDQRAASGTWVRLETIFLDESSYGIIRLTNATGEPPGSTRVLIDAVAFEYK